MTGIPSTAIEAAAKVLHSMNFGAEGFYLPEACRDQTRAHALAILEASGLPADLQAAQERAERAVAERDEWKARAEKAERAIAAARQTANELDVRRDAAEAERDHLASQLQEAREIIRGLRRDGPSDGRRPWTQAYDDGGRFTAEPKP